MADRKQYIVQENENGRIFISEDVISTIAYRAIREIEGFAGLSLRLNAEFATPLNEKNCHKGIHVAVTEKGRLIVELNVLIAYGSAIPTVAENIQSAVGDAIESVTGVRPKKVFVNICGVARI